MSGGNVVFRVISSTQRNAKACFGRRSTEALSRAFAPESTRRYQHAQGKAEFCPHQTASDPGRKSGRFSLMRNPPHPRSCRQDGSPRCCSGCPASSWRCCSNSRLGSPGSSLVAAYRRPLYHRLKEASTGDATGSRESDQSLRPLLFAKLPCLPPRRVATRQRSWRTHP